jgi:uncharacterized ubiquitin-like protein YukD
MDSHVDVTLVHRSGSLDLRVPARITVHHLLEELMSIVPGLGAGAPRHQVRVRGTGLLLTEEDRLDSGPVVTGAVLVLQEGAP